MGLQPERGDVVRSTDPFKLGADRQRPWLIVNTDRHPFADEQFLAVAISTTRYPESVPLPTDAWVVGGVPRQSFASPWAVHSPRTEDLDAWQGRVTQSTVTAVIDTLETYLRRAD